MFPVISHVSIEVPDLIYKPPPASLAVFKLIFTFNKARLAEVVSTPMAPPSNALLPLNQHALMLIGILTEASTKIPPPYFSVEILALPPLIQNPSIVSEPVVTFLTDMT